MSSPRQTRKSHIRLSEYDYSKNGAYFVTVCAKDRKNIFAKIKNDVGTGLARRENAGDTTAGGLASVR